MGDRLRQIKGQQCQRVDDMKPVCEDALGRRRPQRSGPDFSYAERRGPIDELNKMIWVDLNGVVCLDQHRNGCIERPLREVESWLR